MYTRRAAHYRIIIIDDSGIYIISRTARTRTSSRITGLSRVIDHLPAYNMLFKTNGRKTGRVALVSRFAFIDALSVCACVLLKAPPQDVPRCCSRELPELLSECLRAW